MPGQQDLSQFDFQSNPYMSLISQMGGGAPQQQSPEEEQQEVPAEMPMQGAGVPGAKQGAGMQQQPVNQLQSGQNPDRTKFLMGAVQSLEKFITEADTKEDIMLARGIISAISRLIARDQERFTSEIE